MSRVPLAALAVLAATACGKGASPTIDAASDLMVADAPPPPPDQQVSLSIDFTVENCPAFDAEKPSCTGKVPLALRFVPLTTTIATNYRWDFGDYSDFALETTPSHVFTTKGEYTVKLIATALTGVRVIASHSNFIVAKANTTGEPCDTSAQCEVGHFCLCPPREACSVGLAQGTCTSECRINRCDSEEVCADLMTSQEPPTPAEPWQTALCLPKCTDDTDCRDGMRCRTLKPGPQGGAWVRGCFADIPRDIGEPCMDTSGKLRDDFCASGLCLDLGIQGICSMDCENNACLAGSDCVAFGDGRKLCLRGCLGSSECQGDPLLPCAQPTSGDLGYQLAESSSATASTHCAPKSCTGDGDCLPAGLCDDTKGNGHCVRR
jgi:hypothetical protein